jgi:hypothetical protein
MVAPVRGHTGRRQAENPLTPLFRFSKPPLILEGDFVPTWNCPVAPFQQSSVHIDIGTHTLDDMEGGSKARSELRPSLTLGLAGDEIEHTGATPPQLLFRHARQQG